MNKVCKITRREFTISDIEKTIYEKMDVPLPEIHPEEALIRRLSFRNESNFYKSIDAQTGDTILSVFSDQSYVKKIYKQDFWFSDKWDPFVYGREYNFSRPFFEQFKNILLEAPWPNLTIWNSVNSDYCNYVNDDKNCYLDIGGKGNEDCLFVKFAFDCRDSMDLYWCGNMNLSYECMYSHRCHKTFFSEHAVECSDSWFLYDCVNCQNCFGCVNLRNKSYCIWNEQYTRDEYFQKIQEMNLNSRQALESLAEQFKKFRMKFPVKYADIVQSQNASGDHLRGVKDCVACFDIQGDTENCAHVLIGGYGAHDIANTDHVGIKAELVVNSAAQPTVSNVVASLALNACSRIFHSVQLSRCSDCFGCFGLKDAQYCILNKQYSKEEYFEMIEKIKQHMVDMPYLENDVSYVYGDFFPQSFSPYAYNETIAQEYFKKDKEQALSAGFVWSDSVQSAHAVTLSNNQIPDTIESVDKAILSEILECGSGEANAFRVVASELSFYQRMNLPIPRFSPKTRQQHRESRRNPYRLWKRTTEDGVEVMTTYSPDRPEKIYSEEGYNKLIY